MTDHEQMKLSERIRRMGFQNPAGQIVVEAEEYNEILLLSKKQDKRVAQLEDGYKDTLRMASNQGKSPDHEAALIILLNIGDVCRDALADTQEQLTKDR